MSRLEQPSILIVRLSSMGDVVHTLPALVALRKRFPDSRIDWLVEHRHRDILVDCTDVDDLLEVDTLGWRRRPLAPSTWKAIAHSLRLLRQRDYDIVLDLQGTIKSSVCAFLARGERRIGFSTSHLKERAAGLLYRERVSANGARPHVIDRHLKLLTALGIETEERAFPLRVPREMEEVADRNLQEWGLGEFVVLNPGGSWPTKRWSPAKFGSLAAALERERGLPSLVVWGPGEEEIAREIVDASGGAARLAPRTTLREMMPYLERAKLVVSGDTGPMHLASALEVPVVGIFGPTDPERNGPFTPGDEVVFHQVDCGPCYKQRCPGYDNVCMTSIDLEEVLQAVGRRLEP